VIVDLGDLRSSDWGISYRDTEGPDTKNRYVEYVCETCGTLAQSRRYTFKRKKKRKCLDCYYGAKITQKFYYLQNLISKIKREKTIDLQFIIDLWNKQEGRCSVTGIKLHMPVLNVENPHQFSKKYNGKKMSNLRTVSIDRIDNSKGYEPDNVHLVCRFINLGRNDHSYEDLIRIINEIKNS